MTDGANRDARGAESLSRREMIAATAAALAAPLLPVPAAAAQPALQTASKFFTGPELALLDELAELIIPTDAHSPGARAAGVAAYIDFGLADSRSEERRVGEECRSRG